VNRDFLVDTFRQALREQDSGVLYDAGIKVPLSALPSWARYVNLRFALLEQYRIILFIKRLFSPKRYCALCNDFREVQDILQSEFMAAVSEQLRQDGWRFDYWANGWVKK